MIFKKINKFYKIDEHDLIKSGSSTARRVNNTSGTILSYNEGATASSFVLSDFPLARCRDHISRSFQLQGLFMRLSSSKQRKRKGTASLQENMLPALTD